MKSGDYPDREVRNKVLHDMMARELNDYRSWLLQQPPETILNHAYKYTVCEDILLAAKGLNLSSNQTDALVSIPFPLLSTYKKVYDMEAGFTDASYMRTIQTCIVELAEESIYRRDDLWHMELAGKIAEYKDIRWRTPYLHSMSYAAEHDELDKYRASYKANIFCKRAIQEALINNFDGESVVADRTMSILSEFGPERVSYVLGATLLERQLRDLAISESNTAWAETVPVFDDRPQFFDYCVTTNGAILDCFVTMMRQKMEQLGMCVSPSKELSGCISERQTEVKKDTFSEKRKPSVKERLSAKSAPSKTPHVKPKVRRER